MIPQVKNFPANLLKFDSYIKVVDTLEAAIDVIKKKRLAYGQPAIVTYKSNSESTGKTLKRVLFGIGSMDPKDPYFFNIEYDSSGNPVEQSEIITKIEKIIDEWDKHGGFVQTSIKFSKIEPSNINDAEFLSGDIILGEASIKRVLSKVSKTSTDLVTSKGIYTFINNLISSIETEINNLTTKVNYITKDVSTLKSDVSVIRINQNKIISDVSALKSDVYTLKTDTSTLKDNVSVIHVNQNKLIADVSVLKKHDASSILSVVSDSSFITAVTVNKVVKIGADFTNAFSDDFMRDNNGKISLAWNKYEE